MDRLYIITRQDLDPGMQLAQSVHAAVSFVLEHLELVRSWTATSNNVVCLAVPDETALQALVCQVEGRTPHSKFEEPDLGGKLTAVALGGEARRLVSSLPLALRQIATVMLPAA